MEPIAFPSSEKLTALARDRNTGAFRAIDHACAVYESEDGFEWVRRAEPPSALALSRGSATIQSQNVEHVACGGAGHWHVSFDGGSSWDAVEGAEQTLLHGVRFSPSDPTIAWATGLDRASSRRIALRSQDGGRSFEQVLAHGFGNDPPMALHPRRPDVLYLAGATSLLRFDLADSSIVETTIPGSIADQFTEAYGFVDVQPYALALPLHDDPAVYVGLFGTARCEPHLRCWRE